MQLEENLDLGHTVDHIVEEDCPKLNETLDS